MHAERISLESIARALRDNRRTLFISVAATVLLLSLAFILFLIFAPVARVTSVDFRLEFRGAQQGEYPNGTSFNPTEIVSPPVLDRVFKANDLQRFTTMRDFSDSLFVTESNAELRRLIVEYEAKLSAPGLTPTERSVLEREFEGRRASLSHVDYRLSLIHKEKVTNIPSSLRAKILHDILSRWALLTVKDKGVLLFDIPAISVQVAEKNHDPQADPLVSLEVLRVQLRRLIETLDALSTLPGSRVVRAAADGMSLDEIRARAEDILRFEVSPLMNRVIAERASREPANTLEFFTAQRQIHENLSERLARRADALRRSYELYVQQRAPGLSEQVRTPADSEVVTQLDSGFLEQLAAMARNQADIDYRQDLTESINGAAGDAVRASAELDYYSRMEAQLAGWRGLPGNAAATLGLAPFVNRAWSGTLDVIRETESLHTTVSRYLNASAELYTITGPVREETQRAVSPTQALLIALLILVLAIPAILTAILIRAGIRRL